ncbi:MAG: deoxycytidylate deaminase [Vulcanimicrobiaceae bacterium]
MTKPSWDAYFIGMAKFAAERGTCDRKRVGAVLVLDKRVLATGYNGAPRDWPDCSEAGHLMVQMGERQSCVRTIHAEHNAVLQCAIHGVSCVGATCYTTASPCFDCFKLLAQAGIKRIVSIEIYDGARMHGQDLGALALQAGINLERFEP